MSLLRNTITLARLSPSLSSPRIRRFSASLNDELLQRISINGPLTVAEYMKYALTHPKHGYYMSKDVFGQKGDFITSPEISQVFGELLAVWIAVEYQTLYEGQGKLQLLELGPGRGTLASDVLRTFKQIPFMKDKVSLHLIDVSPRLKQIQLSNLCNESDQSQAATVLSEQSQAAPILSHQSQAAPVLSDQSDDERAALLGKHGFPISWHDSLEQVEEDGVTCLLAHEFFDALPIHKFQKVEDSWREVLVGKSVDDEAKLTYLITAGPNPNTQAYIARDEKRDHVEVSPETGILCQKIADRISRTGGFALLADYGHDGDKTDTFRSFKEHKLHNPLQEPGSADLTADIDFSFVKRCLQNSDVNFFGPISQRRFLHNMGISHRLNKLLSSPGMTGQAVTDLLSAYDMLCDPKQMGERFKFFTIFDRRKSDLPAGFVELAQES